MRPSQFRTPDRPYSAALALGLSGHEGQAHVRAMGAAASVALAIVVVAAMLLVAL